MSWATEAFGRVADWLAVADYESAKERGTKDIIARFARGNVTIQNGAVLDEEDLCALSASADRAMANLEDRARAS